MSEEWFEAYFRLLPSLPPLLNECYTLVISALWPEREECLCLDDILYFYLAVEEVDYSAGPVIDQEGAGTLIQLTDVQNLGVVYLSCLGGE